MSLPDRDLGMSDIVLKAAERTASAGTFLIASNIAIAEGRKIAEQLEKEGKKEESCEVFRAAMLISSAILQKGLEKDKP